VVQAGDMLGLVRAEVVDYIERLIVDMDSGLRRNDEKVLV